MKAVRLSWIDSCGSDHIWDDDATRLRPAKIESVGIIVEDADEYITIGSSFDDNDPPKWDGLLCIPTHAITRRIDLEF